MEGILAVWKPAGWTSHDVVAKVRGIVRLKRIGHAGTLDPMVTGVLPLCLGKATRVVEYMQELPKTYTAVLRLGIATDTEDLSGEVIARADKVAVTMEQVQDALAAFCGEIEQVPPMYSAVKVDGKRLYELAREGQQVERKARRVTIYDLQLLDTALEAAEPTISFRVTCSKGTYIRTLCVDIGRKLGVPAAMAELIRNQSAGFSEADCLRMEEIADLHKAGELGEKLLPADRAVAHLPAAKLPAEQRKLASDGRKVPLDAVIIDEGTHQADQLLRLYIGEHFAGIYLLSTSEHCLKPIKVFA